MSATGEQLATKDRILDAAERLFAEEGIEAASLRAITSAAAVNLAAVNYHFRSKQALAEAVLARRIGPVNQERLRLLESYLQSAGDGPLSLERILESFLAPALRLRRDLGESGAHFLRFMGRLHTEPGETVRHMLQKEFGAIVQRYRVALERALPGISNTGLAWGMHFTIGAMAHAMTGAGLLDIYARGACDPSDIEGLGRRLVGYTAAGLRAQVDAAPKTKRPGNGKK